MRILKNKTESIINCNCCKNTIAYFDSDQEKRFEEYKGEFYLFSTITCPVCGSRIIVGVE